MEPTDGLGFEGSTAGRDCCETNESMAMLDEGCVGVCVSVEHKHNMRKE